MLSLHKIGRSLQSRMASLPVLKFVLPTILSINCQYASFSNLIYSPNLPDWFRFPEGDKILDFDDDFLLPASQESSKRVHLMRITAAEEDELGQISDVLKKRFASPEEVFFALSNCCFARISKQLVDRILRRFSNEWIPAMGFFRWAEACIPYKHSPDSYDLMVDILGKSKRFDRMWSLVDEMSCHGGLISLSTMAKVIRRLAGAARWKDAIDAFHGVDRFGINKDTEAMNILLDSLCKERSVMRARDAFFELRGRISPDSSSFNILIHGWCKARKLDEARQTLEEMRELGFKPCVITYTSLIEAHCLNKDFQKVESILEEMRDGGISPNVITYTIIMHSLGKADKTREAFLVFGKMSDPDASAYNSLIYIFARAGEVRRAWNAFGEMHKRGITPNVTTFNTLISVACSHSMAERALDFFVRMEEDADCKPDIKTYTPLLKLSCGRRWMRMLLYLIGHMFKRDIGLDLGTYVLLVHRLCRSRRVDLACLLYEEMILKGFNPGSHLSAELLEVLGRNKMNAAKAKVQELMFKAHNLQI